MYTFRLEFRENDPTKHLPHSTAHVLLQNSTRDESGSVFVSHECLGPAELEAEVNRLKEELDEILVQGKSNFRRYSAKVARTTAKRADQ